MSACCACVGGCLRSRTVATQRFSCYHVSGGVVCTSDHASQLGKHEPGFRLELLSEQDKRKFMIQQVAKWYTHTRDSEAV